MKQRKAGVPGKQDTVTLRVRVWIETGREYRVLKEFYVTLRVRVWIETRHQTETTLYS